MFDKSKINAALKKIGFGGIEDRNLVPQLAFCVRDHKHFRDLLAVLEPRKRQVAYQQLRPHLSFTAKPLDVYVAEMQEEAERLQLPIYDSSAPCGNLRPFKADVSLDELATRAIRDAQVEKQRRLTLTCAKCTTAESFPSETRREAELAAQRAGWRSNEKSSWCPRCVPTRLTLKLECECGKQHSIRAWDEQDAYASARILGWLIDRSAHCPECAMKLATVN